MDERTLTDADVEAIAETLRKKVVQEFYNDLGKSVWSLAWKSLVLGLIGLVAYSGMKGH